MENIFENSSTIELNFHFCIARSVPNHAHYVCEDFASAVKLASLPPLSDLVETIWILGGTQVYKVRFKKSQTLFV